MATNDNMMDLALRITADPSQAERAMEGLSQKVRGTGAAVKQASEPVIVYDRAMRGAAASAKNWEKVADAELTKLRETTAARAGAAESVQRMAMSQREESAAALTTSERINMLRKQYLDLQQEVKFLGKKPFLSPAAAEGLRLDRELMRDIRTEARGLGAQLGAETSGGVLRGINESLLGMREFRAVFAATIGLASFGFWINEWARLADWTGKALQNMDGIKTAENDIALGAAAKALKQINDQATQQILQPHDARIARAFQEGVQLRIKSLEQLRDEIQGLKDGTLQGEKYAQALQDISVQSRKFGIQGALPSALEQVNEKIKEFRALAAVQQQNLDKSTKKTHQQAAAADDAAKAQARFQAALQVADASIATATPHLPPYIAEIDRLRASLQHADVGIANTTDLLKQQIEWAQRGLPTLRQLGYAINPQEAATAAGLGGPLLTAAQQAQGASAPIIRSTKEIQAAMRAQQQAYQRTAQIARESFSIMGEAVGQYGGTFGRVFSQVSRVISLMINLHRLESVSAVQSANAKANGQVAATGKVSLVKSVFETAEGIAALARLDFHAAALHFASSAKFLSVLGIAASVAGAFASSGGGGGSAAVAAAAGGSSSSASQQSLPPGPLTPKDNSQGSQQQTIQVIFQGPVYGGNAATDEIITNINSALADRRVKMYASHTITGKAIG